MASTSPHSLRSLSSPPTTSPADEGPVSAASLSGLPLELKEKVVEHVRELSSIQAVIEEAEEPGEADKPRYVNSLKMLKDVDRDFYRLCAPYVWEDLNLSQCSPKQLQSLVDEILPLRAGYVQSLSFPVRLSEPKPQQQDDTADAACDEEGALSLVHPVGTDGDTPEEQARAALLASSVDQCSSARRMYYDDMSVSQTNSKAILSALPALSSLADLHVAFFPINGRLPLLLAAVPRLTTLILDCGSDYGGTALPIDPEAFNAALLAMRDLKELSICANGAFIFDDTFFLLPFSFSLTTCSLSTDAVGPGALYGFLQRCGRNLQRLDLDANDDDVFGPSSAPTPSLIHLTSLGVTTFGTAPYIACFGSSPISTFSFSSHGLWDIKPLLAFFERHAGTLRNVKLEVDSTEYASGERISDEDEREKVEEVKRWCESRGIDIEIRIEVEG
ncbi:hypothetical protein JCM10213_006109 [Rhodosporidiobolus nylandii]